jgi:hypothetical protein
MFFIFISLLAELALSLGVPLLGYSCFELGSVRLLLIPFGVA